MKPELLVSAAGRHAGNRPRKGAAQLKLTRRLYPAWVRGQWRRLPASAQLKLTRRLYPAAITAEVTAPGRGRHN